MLHRPDDANSVTVLCGAGVALSCGVPSYRHHGGTWQGERMAEVASSAAWSADPARVRAWHDLQRTSIALAMPNDAHLALARLQQRWGERRVHLITTCVDGLLEKAGAPKVLEVYGSLLRLRCEAEPSHPAIGVFGAQNPAMRCKLCGAALRPDVRWDDEPDLLEAEVETALQAGGLFIAVGTSAHREPAATFIARARAAGARVIEVNTEPHSEGFDEVLQGEAEAVIPRIVREWLGEEED